MNECQPIQPSTDTSAHAGETQTNRPDQAAPVGDPDGQAQPPDLRSRAIAAAHHLLRTDPRRFRRRHGAWHQWADYAQAARRLALALGVPVETVTAGPDPVRRYGPAGRYPGLLLTLTEPTPIPTGARPGHLEQAKDRQWQFIPDLATERSWLLLDECPACEAPAVPVARIACLADLGDYLDPPAGDDVEHLPDDFTFDPGHHPGCPAHLGAESDAPDLAGGGRIVIATWRPNTASWTAHVIGPHQAHATTAARRFTSDRALRRYAASMRALLRYEPEAPLPPDT